MQRKENLCGVTTIPFKKMFLSCYDFQLCQLSVKDPYKVRHHDDDVAKTPDVVDGNIQASCKRHIFNDMWLFYVTPKISLFLHLFLPWYRVPTPSNHHLTPIYRALTSYE